MKRGPKAKCDCGECHPCRARRRRNGEKLDNRRMRESLANMPKDAAIIGYLAGLLDGEGCITRNNKCWRVQIAMTDERVILWLGQFGGTVRSRKVKGKRKPCWRWLLMRQREVLAFLRTVRSLLIVKTAQAEIAIRDIEERLA